MFAVLTVLLCISLVTFGAVLPNTWLLLAVLWMGCIAIYVVFRTLQGPRLSLSELVLFLSGALLFGFAHPKLAVGLVAAVWSYVAAQKSPKGTLRFLRALVVIGVLEALLGLVQVLISPGWIFGYINPFNEVSGTLINRNHYAGLLEMLFPATLGFAYIAIRRHEGARSYVYVLAGALMGVSLFFSLSRMGILSFLLTGTFLAVLLGLRDSRQRMATALGLGMLALVVGGAAWIGIDVIVGRYLQLAEQDAVVKDARVLIFKDTIQMIAANPLGVGVGQYQDLFRRYQVYRPDRLFDHAHNDYLETAAEWGIPLALIFWGGLAWIFVRAVRGFLAARSSEQCGILLACIGAIFAIFVHSLTDFNLQIPSNAILFFSIVGIAAANSVTVSESLRR
jgi:O-antigen ligase